MTNVTHTAPNSSGLTASNLNISAAGRGGAVEIVDNVSFEVGPGEAIAIVGESGSGKSLTARAILGLLPAGVEATGTVRYQEHDLIGLSARVSRRIRGNGLALVMQDPFTMLNPLERVGAQITDPLTDDNGRRLDRQRRRSEAVQRLHEVGIDDPAVADKYPFQLSGGMRQRVGIAAAIALRPQVLIADEPTTALDVTTQQDILDLLNSLRLTHNMALVLITHDLRVAFSTCERVYVMYAGRIVETASAAALWTTPQHPYSLGLLLADPPADRRVVELIGVSGNVPAPGSRPTGCVFRPRCDWAQQSCAEQEPELQLVAPRHETRCARVGEIGDDLLKRRSYLQAADDAPTPAPTATSVALATARSVTKRFTTRGGRGAPTVALNAVDIVVNEGESVGLVGESGSGKTTLGRIIVGLETADEGEISVGGTTLAGRPNRKQRRQLSGVVQIAFQDPYSSLNPARSIGSALAEAVKLGEPVPDVAAEVSALLDQVGLPPDFARRQPSALSGGERQRVAIARALARHPQLLVCDEVASALDVSVQAQLLTLLRNLRNELGLSYLFITHDLAVVRQITDRVYVMWRGRVVESGDTARVLDHPEHDYTRRLVASVPSVSAHRTHIGRPPDRSMGAHR